MVCTSRGVSGNIPALVASEGQIRHAHALDLAMGRSIMHDIVVEAMAPTGQALYPAAP